MKICPRCASPARNGALCCHHCGYVLFPIADKDIPSLGGRGILRPGDMKDLRAASARVALLLADGLWHSADEIRYAAGNGPPASEGLRRARELRDIPGLVLECEREPGHKRLFRYRLSRKPEDPAWTAAMMDF